MEDLAKKVLGYVPQGLKSYAQGIQQGFQSDVQNIVPRVQGLQTGVNETLGVRPDTTGYQTANPAYQQAKRAGNIGGMGIPMPGAQISPEALSMVPLLAGALKTKGNILMHPEDLYYLERANDVLKNTRNPGETVSVAKKIIDSLAEKNLTQEEISNMGGDTVKMARYLQKRAVGPELQGKPLVAGIDPRFPPIQN